MHYIIYHGVLFSMTVMPIPAGVSAAAAALLHPDHPPPTERPTLPSSDYIF